MAIVTVLTPTYNRKTKLKDLFESLANQQTKDFKWLIVDDGSSDDTESMVSEWINSADFTIEYHKKVNGGKHTALNYAYQFIQTPLTFIVDSDDSLSADAITIIELTYHQYSEEKDLCGFSFLRGTHDGGILSSARVPEDGMKESYVDCRINRNIGGDMAEVWYTDCLKEYPFPEFESEKFLGEDLVWIRMSEKYKMRFFNKIIYISDYLEDGLTLNRRKHNIASPNGCVKRAEAFLNSNSCFKAKLRAMLQYYIYGRFAGITISNQFKHVKNKVFYIVLVPFAHIMYIDWKRKNSN